MSLIHHWKCQDNAASTVVVATVGTDLALTGGDNTEDISIVSGPGTAFPLSFDFDGAADYLATLSLSFASGSAFSVCGWVWSDDGSLEFMGTNGTTSSRVRATTSTNILVRCGSTNSNFTVPTITIGAWHHLFVSRTAGDSLRLFWDGSESSTGAVSNAGTFAPTWVGRQNANYHNGRQCDIRAFDSDEAANVATIMAEKDAAGGHPASRRLAMCQRNERGVIVI